MASFPSKVNYATGDILTAANMNDDGTAINLLEGSQWAAGKNKIINGDFGIWQRGTSFSPTSAANMYSADRWSTYQNGTGTFTTSQQAFTAGTAPVAGYEGQYFIRNAITTLGTSTAMVFSQRIEDVRQFAAQTVTVSFWSKSLTGLGTTVGFNQNFGSGGSATVSTSGSAITNTTSWQRFTQTIAIPSITGKTIGTSSYLELTFTSSLTANQSIDIWGVQVEAASTASNFQTATGTKQGELAACQRYYYRNFPAAAAYSIFSIAQATSATVAYASVPFPVPMRVNPSAVEVTATAANYAVTSAAFGYVACSVVPVLAGVTTTQGQLGLTVAAGIVAGNAAFFVSNNSTAAYVGFSAEL
jgi:hypothetical protein